MKIWIMMDKFEEREIEGRGKWLKMNYNAVLLGKKIIQFTEDKFNPVDFYMTAGTKTSVGDIKTLHRDYMQYPDFQIDYIKLKEIKDRATDGRIPYLVVFFNDYHIVWDLSKIDIEERKHIVNCTATTAQNYNKGKKEKEEVCLTMQEAIYVRKAA